VGLAPARSATEQLVAEGGSQSSSTADATEKTPGVSSGVGRAALAPAAVASTTSAGQPPRLAPADAQQEQLEHSGRSGRSGPAGSSLSGASEVSEDFPSEFEPLSPGGSRQEAGSKFGDTLELSATMDNEEGAAVVAAAAKASGASSGGGRVAAAAPGEAGRGQAAAEGDRWQTVTAQLDSLARSLAMLKDIRGKQREYLKLLQVTV